MARNSRQRVVSSTAKLRIWTLRIWGFWGPGFHSARQVLCGDASRPFLDHFHKHLSSVLGRTELCHEVRNPGPQNPKSSATKTTTWHCSLASRKRCDLKTRKRCDFYPAAQKIASDFSAISSAIFWRFFCDFCGKTLRFSALRFENAVIFLRLRFFGTLGTARLLHDPLGNCALTQTRRMWR